MSWNILCDFDGTVSVEDVIDSLLCDYGRPGWQYLEQQWRAGLLGSRDCMQQQVALLEMDQATLDAHLDQVRIDPGFENFVRRAEALSVPLGIVSDGLDYAIQRILRRHGLDHLPVAANRLIAKPPLAWRMESPFQQPGCGSGTCKCDCALQAKVARPQRTLLIGDGASDFCVADRVDFVFAKNRLIEHCHAAGIPYVAIAGFDDALEFLPRLLDGSLISESTPLPAAIAR